MEAKTETKCECVLDCCKGGKCECKPQCECVSCKKKSCIPCCPQGKCEEGTKCEDKCNLNCGCKNECCPPKA